MTRCAGGRWGTRVRLSGGRLAHYAGKDHDGTSWLAHGDYAWSDTLRPADDDAEDCSRCVRKLPALEHMIARAIEEDIARRCDCGGLMWWPSFRCGECQASDAA